MPDAFLFSLSLVISAIVNIKGAGKILRANAEGRVVLVGRRSVVSMKARS